MSTPAKKADLARIRDNQRRSRAQRREYQQELEQRLRVFELQGVEASPEVQSEARRVEQVHRRLRELLNRHGISDEDITGYLDAGTIVLPDRVQASSHFAASNPGQTVQSHLMAPQRPAPLEANVPYSFAQNAPQDSREASTAGVSTSSSSIWQPMQPIQASYGRPVATNMAQTTGRQSIPTPMPPQPYNPPVFAGMPTPQPEAYHPAPPHLGSMMEGPMHQGYPAATSGNHVGSAMADNIYQQTRMPGPEDPADPRGQR